MGQLHFSQADQEQLLSLVRQAIKAHCLGETVQYDAAELGSRLHQKAACFVTLTSQQGELRGCIGHLEVSQPLYRDAIDNGIAAANHDPRFNAVTLEQLETLHIEISALGHMQPLPVQNRHELEELISRRHPGVIFNQGSQRSVFLPQVWDKLPQASLFVDALLRKGGWRCWPDGLQVTTFSITEIAEKQH